MNGPARMLVAARLLSFAAALIVVLAVLGYLSHALALVRVRSDLRGMSPLTALGLLSLAAATFASTSVRDRRVAVPAGVSLGIATLVLGSHIVAGGDVISPPLGRFLFDIPEPFIGRSSIATALSMALTAGALLTRRSRPLVSDVFGGCSLVLSGMALLGYLYGVSDLYALPMFNSMALNTAAALAMLSLAVLFAEPEFGWAGVIASHEMGGGATRRQLSFIALPIVAGWLLLHAVGTSTLGPAIAMPSLVIVTVVPLAILILRDGRVLNTLDRERRAKLELQRNQSREMAERLAAQADALAEEAAERAKAEAAMFRAQRMEAVGQLTGGIAHDFNNLLMAIRGNLELMQLRLPAAEERLHRYLGNATSATDRGARITGQLLAFSRSQRLDIRAFEADPVLVSARELIGSSLGPTIDVSLDLRTAGVWIKADPDQLELAILNLAVNARDAMPDGGHLRIQSSSCADRLSDEHDHANYVSIQVADDGVGMSEETAAKAIEPFFTTKEQGKGTGLGLAQVYGFVRQCGGDLRITSLPGAGTTVEILLPCTDAIPSIAEMPEGTAVRVERASPGGQVLVIDDDDGVRAVIVEALLSAGFGVIEAADGLSGLALLDRSRPAAAVIDFLMPGMNGAEVARHAQIRWPGLPIVFVSGYSDTIALDGIAGAIVLRKPFDVNGLSRALNSVLH